MREPQEIHRHAWVDPNISVDVTDDKWVCISLDIDRSTREDIWLSPADLKAINRALEQEKDHD